MERKPPSTVANKLRQTFLFLGCWPEITGVGNQQRRTGNGFKVTEVLCDARMYVLVLTEQFQQFQSGKVSVVILGIAHEININFLIFFHEFPFESLIGCALIKHSLRLIFHHQYDAGFAPVPRHP